MSAGRIVLLLIVATAAARLALAGMTGLGPDEAYMVGNARILSLSYFDHPPIHVWLAAIAARTFGETDLALRLPFILCFAGSTWLMFRLTAILFGAAAGLCAAVAFNLVPVFSVAHGSWVLPDGPLILFLLAAALTTAKILFADPPGQRPTLRWIGAGALGGLALLSKYSAVFFFGGVLAFLLSTPVTRRHLAAPGPWLGGLVALVLFTPVIVWNITNGMAGVAFQGNRFSDLPTPKIGALLGNIGGQAAYLSPWLFLLLLYSLIRALRAGSSEPRGWFLALQAAGPIVVFCFLSLWVRSFPHWSMPGWLFAVPLLGREVARVAITRPRLVRNGTLATAIVFLVIVAAFAIQVTRGGILSVGPLDKAARDPTVASLDWTALAESLAARALLVEGRPVAAPDWITAGKASYALGPDVPVLCLCREPHHFLFRAAPAAFAGGDAVLVFPDYEKKRALATLNRYFDSLAPLDPVEIQRNGETVLILDVMMGHNLRPPEKR